MQSQFFQLMSPPQVTVPSIDLQSSILYLDTKLGRLYVLDPKIKYTDVASIGYYLINPVCDGVCTGSINHGYCSYSADEGFTCTCFSGFEGQNCTPTKPPAPTCEQMTTSETTLYGMGIAFCVVLGMILFVGLAYLFFKLKNVFQKTNNHDVELWKFSIIIKNKIVSKRKSWFFSQCLYYYFFKYISQSSSCT